MASPRCNIKLDPNVNEVVSCVENGTLRGIPADSASPTDVYIFKFKPNTFYGGDNVENGFMKVFVSNTDRFASASYIHFQDEIKALEYEITVYERTKKLVDSNVIGHFVKYFTSLIRPTSFENLKKFISDKAGIDIIRAGLNLERNTIMMIYPQAGSRPAITNPVPVRTRPLFLNSSEKLLVKYKFLLTEAVVPYNIPAGTISTEIQDFKTMMPINSSIKLQYINDFLPDINCSTQINECQFVCNTVLEIYFQLAVTTYAMALNNFVHNDLHDGNVWVKRTNPINIKYTLKDVAGSPSYTLTSCNNFSMLYDYDRAYKNRFDNPLLANSPDLANYNQTNELIQQRDFVKVLCYMIHNLLPKIVRGTVRKYKLLAEDNIKTQLYNELLNCICKNNTTGFVNWPTVGGVIWDADRTKWPNEIDRYRDFWDRIFNNLEIYNVGGNKETDDLYECFLNQAGGKVDPITKNTTFIELNHLSPALYEETLYTMPEIIENISQLINKYNPGKIQKNNSINGYYNYDVRRVITFGSTVTPPPVVPRTSFFGLFP